MLWYSLEAPRWGASNEYPQHMFLLRNKKDVSIFRMKKAPYTVKPVLKATCIKQSPAFKGHYFRSH